MMITLIIMMQWVSSLAVLSDGRLASGSGDNTIRIWDLGGGTCDRVLEGHEGVREGDGCVLFIVYILLNVDYDFTMTM